MTLWQEFPWRQDIDLDPSRDRLCAETPEPVRLDCRIEGANFVREPAPEKSEIVVCAYNAERGLQLDDQLRAFAENPGMPSPDVLLLSEADRGCTRTRNRNVAREYARALAMFYVYGVEFIELPRIWGPGGPVCRRCEHGNAIISRYPLGNVRLIRHRVARNWNSALQRVLHIGEPRLGGRAALAADVRVGQRLLRIYSVHFESGSRRHGWRTADAYREAQARELVEDAEGVSHGVVIGGDMNVGRYLGLLDGSTSPEPTTAALFEAGYEDAHASIPPLQRITTDSGVAIDLLFGRRVRFKEAGVGPRQIWGGLSNHLPVWAQVRL